jgi:branched-chain amino acid transport system permease protein
MHLFLQQSMNGLLLGGMFALISIGLSLMFGVMKVANFAYGALYMLGGYAAFWASDLLGVPNWVAILVAFAAAFMMGALMEGIGFGKFRGNEEATLIFGLGVALIARGGAVLAWGSQSCFIPFSFNTYRVGGLVLPAARIWACVASLAIVAGVYFVVNRTAWGRIIRAVSDNAERARLVGFNTRLHYLLTAGLATGLAGTASVLLIPVFSLSPAVDDSALYTAMAVVILGGLGSIPGCIVGGLVLGIVTAFSFGYLPSPIAPALPLLLLILTLALKPDGLFGSTERAV